MKDKKQDNSVGFATQSCCSPNQSTKNTNLLKI